MKYYYQLALGIKEFSSIEVIVLAICGCELKISKKTDADWVNSP